MSKKKPDERFKPVSALRKGMRPHLPGDAKSMGFISGATKSQGR